MPHLATEYIAGDVSWCLWEFSVLALKSGGLFVAYFQKKVQLFTLAVLLQQIV